MDDERTLWWIATRTGTHYSLVSYWLWEAEIPLMERNLTAEPIGADRVARTESQRAGTYRERSGRNRSGE